jgi:hypothetical protein
MATNASIITAVKAWIFPGLLSIATVSMLNDLSQIKSDIRTLMTQSNIDKTRIDNIERRVGNLENSIYLRKDVRQSNLNIVFPSRYFIKEEEFDVTKYLRKKA